MAVSALIFEAVEAALRAAQVTGGLVDPTVGAALQGLGYDRDFAAVTPGGPAIRVTCGPCRLAPGAGRSGGGNGAGTPGVQLDLGATAKALCAVEPPP